MSCPICGRVLCDHSPAERGQTPNEVEQDLEQELEDRRRSYIKYQLGLADKIRGISGQQKGEEE